MKINTEDWPQYDFEPRSLHLLPTRIIYPGILRRLWARITRRPPTIRVTYEFLYEYKGIDP